MNKKIIFSVIAVGAIIGTVIYLKKRSGSEPSKLVNKSGSEPSLVQRPVSAAMCRTKSIFVRNTANGEAFYLDKNCNLTPWRRITADGTFAGKEADKNKVDQAFILSKVMTSTDSSVQDIIKEMRMKYNVAI